MKDLLKSISEGTKTDLKFAVPLITAAVGLMIIGVELWMPLFIVGFMLFIIAGVILL